MKETPTNVLDRNYRKPTMRRKRKRRNRNSIFSTASSSRISKE